MRGRAGGLPATDPGRRPRRRSCRPDRAPARHANQGCERRVRQQLGDLGFRGGDLSVQAGQQRKIIGQDPAGHHSLRRRQGGTGCRHQPVRRRPPNPQPTVGGEPDKPGNPQCRQAVRIGELRSDQTAHLSAQHIRQRHRQPGKTTVQLAEQLILHRSSRLDPAATVHRPPGELGDRRRPGRHRNPMTGQHQFGDRLQIDGIGLDPPPALDPPLLS